jgi:hypothetical protein
MKYLTASALAALLVGSMSLGGLAPARADDAATAAAAPAAQTSAGPTDNATPQGGMMRQHMHRQGMRGHGGQGMGLLNLACSSRSAEALEIGLVRLKYAVQPTAAQVPLFDALRTAALDNQKTFANACTTALGAAASDKGSLVDRLQRRLDIDTARVAALGNVMPKLKAFYDSLTPDQQKALQGRGMRGPGQRGGAWSWQQRSGAGGAMPHARMPQWGGQPSGTSSGSTSAPADQSAPSGSSD